jgi:enoyl-CoA hydratase
MIAMRDYNYLRCEVDGPIATVWLNRPPVNAVNQEMYREVRHMFSDVAALGPGVRVIVLTGAGRHFCAGNDLTEFESMTPENASARMQEVREAFWAIHDCPLPVVGAVHGTAVGTGLALAASCDFVVAAEGAMLGAPEIGVGVMGAAKHLSRLVPQPQVRWMFLSGEPVAVEDLVRLGALVAVVSPDELLADARARANAIARHSPVAIRFAKQALNRIEFMDLKSGYEVEQGLTGELSGYPDSKEARLALLDRRMPQYMGS